MVLNGQWLLEMSMFGCGRGIWTEALKWLLPKVGT